jgi:hypothetical protein
MFLRQFYLDLFEKIDCNRQEEISGKEKQMVRIWIRNSEYRPINYGSTGSDTLFYPDPGYVPTVSRTLLVRISYRITDPDSGQ